MNGFVNESSPSLHVTWAILLASVRVLPFSQGPSLQSGSFPVCDLGCPAGFSQGPSLCVTWAVLKCLTSALEARSAEN